MIYLVSLLMLLIGLIDTILFVLLGIKLKLYVLFFIVHVLIYLIIKIISNIFLKDTRDIPNYIGLFLPGLGPIIISILYFSLNYFVQDSIILEDYKRYIRYDNNLVNGDNLSYEEEMRTLSFLDQMNLLTSGVKKDIILSYNNDLYSENARFLKQGLLDEDNEVTHYSAIALNMLENEYTYLINELQNNYTLNKDKKTLRNLASVYKSYIESGILSDRVLNVFIEEYIEILEKLLKIEENFEDLNQLVKYYIKINRFSEGSSLNEIILDKYHDRFEGVLNQLHIYYKSHKYNKLLDMILSLKEKGIKIPSIYEDKFKFWLGKGDEL